MVFKRTWVVALLLIAAAAAGYLTRSSWMGYIPGMGGAGGGFKIVEKDGVKYKECYTCPMHPQVIKPGPGDCPICGMTLVKKLLPADETAGGQRKTAEGFNIVEEAGKRYKECYICPMHPDVVKPGQEPCPICGMDLEKKELPLGADEKMGGPAMDEKEHAMLAKIVLDPRDRMLANVATTRVGYREFSTEVYTVGRVGVDEDTIRKATAWFAGRIERMYVHYNGEYVKKGGRIMSVYSPELVSTQKEYLIAKRTAARLGSSSFSEITGWSGGLVDAARRRMKLWGVTDAQIARLDETGVPDGSLDVYSKVSGTVTDITAREGSYVMEGSELFTVAQLGSVWVNAEVYEYEFSKVRQGAAVEITAEAYPGMKFMGRVGFIDPMVNNESRTVNVRAVIQNPSGMLRPGMFVNARILSAPKRALTVPASAVLYTGTREIVWVETGPGEFEPRQVTLGMRSGGEFEVISGLEDGNMAVTEGGFLLDSEAQLKASAGGEPMPGMEMGGTKGTEESPAQMGHRH